MIRFTLSDSGKEECIFYKNIDVPIEDLRKRAPEYASMLLNILKSKLPKRCGLVLSLSSLENSIYRVAENFLEEVYSGLANEDILLGCSTIKNLPLFADFLIQKGYKNSDKEDGFDLTMNQNTADTVLDFIINEIDYTNIEQLEKDYNINGLKNQISLLIDNKNYLKAGILLMKAKIIKYTSVNDYNDTENILSDRERLNNIFMY